MADCLGVDARFIYILARRAAPCGTTPGSGRSSSSAPAAGAAGSENEEEDDDEEAWPASRPAPLGALHSLNARQCRGWTDATTAALLSPEGCGARNLRRLYLGDTAAVATGGGSGGSGMEEEQGGLEDGEGDGGKLFGTVGGGGGGGGCRLVWWSVVCVLMPH